MHARAVDPEDRLGHEGGHQAVLVGDRLDGVLQRQHVVGRSQRIGEAEIDLVLAAGHLMVTHFDLQAHAVQRVHELGAHVRSLVI